MNTIMDKEIIQKSLDKAISGGKAGTMAMACQVTSLMWLRTTVNYQYRYGVSMKDAFRTLYTQGGIGRFYKGILPALLQAPLSRFGDTAMNMGVMHYCNANEDTKNLPIAVKTLFGSVAAGLWRINLMPIDSCKTIMQVEGKQGIPILMNKIKENGIKVLYTGSLASCTATIVGHFPWFLTFNALNESIPEVNYNDNLFKALGRNAFIGFSSSLISDTVSNSSRVVKVYKQASPHVISYPQIVKDIVKTDGVIGLFGRGLKTKIMSNGIQGIMFTILLKYFQEIN
jgi:hypothetical protein